MALVQMVEEAPHLCCFAWEKPRLPRSLAQVILLAPSDAAVKVLFGLKETSIGNIAQAMACPPGGDTSEFSVQNHPGSEIHCYWERIILNYLYTPYCLDCPELWHAGIAVVERNRRSCSNGTIISPTDVYAHGYVYHLPIDRTTICNFQILVISTIYNHL